MQAVSDSRIDPAPLLDPSCAWRMAHRTRASIACRLRMNARLTGYDEGEAAAGPGAAATMRRPPRDSPRRARPFASCVLGGCGWGQTSVPAHAPACLAVGEALGTLAMRSHRLHTVSWMDSGHTAPRLDSGQCDPLNSHPRLALPASTQLDRSAHPSRHAPAPPITSHR